MSGLTERVARAIQQTDYSGVGVSEWDALSGGAKDMFRAEARAAIALVIEEAAKICDSKRDEYEESATVEWQASNDEYSLRMGDKSDVCVEIAAAIRALKEDRT